MGSADLHVHSRHSDGTLTPAEIADRAAARGVSVLAIADHDEVAGSLALAPLCAARGMRYIPAVEHTALYNGRCYHVLGYDADLRDESYLALAQRARRALEGMSHVLIERMAPDEPRVSTRDFAAFERDPALGGWAGIEYLMKRGVTGSLREGMRYYAQYDVQYEHADFPSLRETIDAIRAAGGRSVLAHPGEMVPGSGRAGMDDEDRPGFRSALLDLLEQGLDGIECHYPLHSDWVTEMCLRLCAERGLLITAGSDCHGSFGTADVGDMSIDESLVNI